MKRALATTCAAALLLAAAPSLARETKAGFPLVTGWVPDAAISLSGGLVHLTADGFSQEADHAAFAMEVSWN